MSEFSLIVDILSLITSVGLVYYAFRLLLIFRGGKKAGSWMYILTGILIITFGSCLFTLRHLLGLQENFVRPLGGIMMLIGAILMLIGMRLEYRSWSLAM